jgi:rubredoxin
MYQFWHRKLMLFHSKRKFGKFLSNVKGIPITFFLPEELDVALDVMRSCTECNWIYKPSHGSGGFGVRAVGIEEIEEIKRKRDAGTKTALAVLQRAVTSLLVDNPGRKFDLRVYVAVASWKPLVAFILPDSLVRLAYRPFTKDTKDKCATRTNTAQRKYCAVEDEDFATVTHNRTVFFLSNQSRKNNLTRTNTKQVHWKSPNMYGV